MTETRKKPVERIGWDDPLCQMGIVPGYLLQERFGYTDLSWKKVTANWSFCKDINGEPWFNLDAFKAYPSNPNPKTPEPSAE